MFGRLFGRLPRERKEFLEKQAAEAIGKDPRMSELKARLLATGGKAVCFAHDEPDIQEILSRGKVFSAKSISLRPGHLNSCHGNVAHLWSRSSGESKIVTGYAVGHDGVWRQHTWAVEDRNDKPMLIETTQPMRLYYGFVLDADESVYFYECNKEELSGTPVD